MVTSLASSSSSPSSPAMVPVSSRTSWAKRLVGFSMIVLIGVYGIAVSREQRGLQQESLTNPTEETAYDQFRMVPQGMVKESATSLMATKGNLRKEESSEVNSAAASVSMSTSTGYLRKEEPSRQDSQCAYEFDALWHS